MKIVEIALALNYLIKNFERLVNTIQVTPENIQELKAVASGLQELNELCNPERTQI